MQRPRDPSRAAGALSILAVALATNMAHAQPRARAIEPAALLFAYRPTRGEEARFHDGYRRHLDWHRTHGDTLPWYGWEVLTGERVGLFIDGTFGNPLQAIDVRVDPVGDERDLIANIGSVSQLAWRVAYRLRRDLSTATPLEDRMPSPLIEVITYHVRPGAAMQFEQAARGVRACLLADDAAPRVTWYELVNGGPHQTFTMLVHRRGLADWDERRVELGTLIAGISDRRLRDALLSSLRESVVSASSETWRFLPASSAIPPR